MYDVPYMPRGDDSEHQGFMRITNLSASPADIDVWGYGDDGQVSSVAQFSLAAGATRGYRISELEGGAPDKNLAGSIGTGTGDWRINFESSAALRIVGFYRNPQTGFLNSLHDTAHAGLAGQQHILPMVNPGSNPSQVGKIRLVSSDLQNFANVQIFGIDDQGVRFPETGFVDAIVPAGGALTLTMAELEQGSSNSAVTGALGDGAGKWRLNITSNTAIGVMSLIFAPNGYLSNVSSSGHALASDGGRFPIDCGVLDGATIMSGSNPSILLGFFGASTANASIFNTLGPFGSLSGENSIANFASPWGSLFSDFSAFNDAAQLPPVLVKHGRVIGRLTTNSTLLGALDTVSVLSACIFTSDTTSFLHSPRDFAQESSELN